MYVLDTNIIIDNPYSVEKEDIAIPINVIFELNKFKSDKGKRGYSARRALKLIFNHNVVSEDSAKSKYLSGEPIEILYNAFTINEDIARGLGQNDFDIMKAARDNKSKLYTSDTAMAICANIIEVDVEFVIHIPETYDGYEELYVDTCVINSIAAGDITELPDIYYTCDYNDEWQYEVKSIALTPTTLMSNEYLKLMDINNDSHITYARYDYSIQSLVPIKHKIKAFGIEPMPKNIGQTIFMDALMNPDIKIMTVKSEAGAGKSLLALAAAIEQTVVSKKPLYSKTYIFRALEAVSEEIGFLPGDANDKVDRWHDSLYDSFELLLNKNKIVKQPSQITRDYMKGKLQEYNIEIGVLTFIRGRSLQGSLIIIDEAQNITPDVMRTIVTRCGAGTKLVILGDPSQVDNHVCNKEYNGLTHVMKSLYKRHLPQYAHITLEKCERSDIAEIGIKYL